MLGVLLGLTLTGVLLGALAGAATVAVLLFAIGIRHGRIELPLSSFGSVLGALVGGALGTVLAPAAAFTPWRQVPVGRLVAHLTIGTVLGGGACALLLPNPAAALLGGILGFLIAGDRLVSRTTASPAPSDEPRTPAG